MRYFALVALILFCFGCKSKKTIVTKKTQTVEKEQPKDIPGTTPTSSKPKSFSGTTIDYIDLYKDIAVHEMRQYGIPASITLAQGILESGSGKGRLAAVANNHFGIKCHGWNGEAIYHDDDRKQECFRKYKLASESFRDHSEFLAGRKRYAKLFDLKINDYKGWAKELRRAGYATDPKYPQKLISLIERYELHKYDEVNSEFAIAEIPEEHTVVKGDTLYSIAKRYNLSVDRLKAMNSLNGNTIEIGQKLNLSDNDK